MSHKEDKLISRAAKLIKFGGFSLFLAVNTYLAFHYATAYEDGKVRGQ